jgi:hypothetical protein
MHVAAILLSVALLVAGYVCIFRSLLEQFELQHEINRKLPASRQFEPAFWSLDTHDEFKQLQKELLPDSPRPHRLRAFSLTGFALLISGALLLVAALGR